MTRKLVEWKYALWRLAKARHIHIPSGFDHDTEAWGAGAQQLARAVQLSLHLTPANGTLSPTLKNALRPYLFRVKPRYSLYNFTPYWRGGRGIKFIVLHHTAYSGPEENVVAYFRSPTARANAHYTIGKDGDIYQTCPDKHAGWHAGAGWFDWSGNRRIESEERLLNKHSIGIEINNAGTGRDPFTDRQVRAVAWLVAKKMKRYSIPARNVTDHKAVNKVDGKTDMAGNWPWKRFWEYVKVYRWA